MIKEYEKLKKDLIKSMKAKTKKLTAVYKMLKSQIDTAAKNASIDYSDITDEFVHTIVLQQLKEKKNR